MLLILPSILYYVKKVLYSHIFFESEVLVDKEIFTKNYNFVTFIL